MDYFMGLDLQHVVFEQGEAEEVRPLSGGNFMRGSELSSRIKWFRDKNWKNFRPKRRQSDDVDRREGRGHGRQAPRIRGKLMKNKANGPGEWLVSEMQ